MKKNLATQKGFTLVEMLVAVSVLLIVIIGPMTITSRAAKSSSFATEQVQAFFLAQEGLELAQKVRDDLLLQNFTTAWSRFTDESNGGTYRWCYSSGCGLDWDTAIALGSVVDCSTITNCAIKYKASASRSKFTYSTTGSTVNTPFTRKIDFKKQGNNAVEVISTVTWRSGSSIQEQKVESRTYLYNIYAN